MAKKIPKFTFDGSYTAESDDNYWTIRLLSGGTFSFNKAKTSFDAFLVGGGAGGNSGYTYCGGAGGCGGKTLTKSGLSCAAGETFDIVIGKGGAGGSGYAGYGGAGGETSAFGASAAGGTVAIADSGVKDATYLCYLNEGGCGGGAGAYKPSSYLAAQGGADGADGAWTGANSSGKGQGTTTRAFGESGGALYASGGGGGGFVGVSDGASGGDTTAGTGGSANRGGDAQDNTGAGGGGGGGTSSVYYDGGRGADGIVILRGTQEDLLPIIVNGTQIAEVIFNGTEAEGFVLDGTVIY